MHNDPVLMAFNTWRVLQPDLQDAGLVTAWSDSATRTCGVLWAGPDSPALARMREEAEKRGINFVVRSTKYSTRVLESAMHAVWDAAQALAELGFVLNSTAGTNLEREGIVVGGMDLRDPDADLDEQLVAAVRSFVGALVEISGQIAFDDIHVERTDVRPA